MSNFGTPLVDMVSLTHISTSTTSLSTTLSSTTLTNTSTTGSATSTSPTASTSTMTTSSTTGSATTTTSSTLFFVRLESAEMRRGFTEIFLTFNAPVMLTGQTSFSRLVPCKSVFAASTTASLGFLPECAWLEEGRNLRVTLGSETTGVEMIRLGQLMTIPAGTLTVNRFAVSLPAGPTPHLNASVFATESLVRPRVLLAAQPQLSQSCGRISVSVAGSTGSAGRALQMTWRFGPKSTKGLADLLAAALPAPGVDFFMIRPTDLSAAVKTYLDEMPGSSALQLEFVVNASNWLGLSDEGSAIVSIEAAGEPVPVVSPTTSTVLEISSAENAEFGIETSFVDPSQCTSAIGIANAPPSTEVVIVWEYRQLGASNWTQLDRIPQLQDLARSPGDIRFAPFTFTPGSQHQFKATASYVSSSSAARKPSYTFNLTVTPRAAPVPVIAGPSEVAEACAFELDASGSVDASLPPGATPDLTYDWSCYALTDNATDCSTGNMSSLLALAQEIASVKGAQLLPGRYSFKLKVRRKTDGSTGNATFTVRIVSSSKALPIVIRAPWENMSSVSTQVGSRLGDISAVVQGDDGACQVPPSWKWQWALVEDALPRRVVALLDTTVARQDTENSVHLTTSDFRGSLMEPGKIYAYALLMTKNEVEMDAITSFGAQDLDTYIRSGATVRRSDPFLADAPPSSGTLMSQPMYGFSAMGIFTISTQGWLDENPDELSFALYRFPLPSNVTLTRDGSSEGIVLSGDIQRAIIDWHDSTNPRFWSTLGGRLLRPLGQSSLFVDLSMPAGAHMLAVKAVDKLGATGDAILFGPLVDNPPFGIESDVATNLISESYASADADQILTTIDAVALVPLANSTSAEQAEVTGTMMTAMEKAVSFLEPSSESIQTVGDVLSSVLVSSAKNGPAGRAKAAQRASQLMSSVLDLASTGVDAAAGTALLGSINQIGNAYASAGSTSEGPVNATETAIRSQELQNLVSKLGDSAMKLIPLGATQSLRSVDAAGRGIDITLMKTGLDGRQTAAPIEAPGGLRIPGSALINVRRLQAELGSNGSCTELGIQQTDWLSSNPYHWANSSIGLTHVATDASVKVLEITKCGTIFSFSDIDPPMSMDIQMPAAPAADPPYGYSFEPRCARFDSSGNQWTTDGLRVLQPLSIYPKTVQCLATIGGSAYTGLFLPVPLPPTFTATAKTTTVTATVATSTSTATAQPTPPSPDSMGMIVGITFASIFGLFCLSLASLYTYRWLQRGPVANVAVNRPNPAEAWKAKDDGGGLASDPDLKGGLEPEPSMLEQGKARPETERQRSALQRAAEEYWRDDSDSRHFVDDHGELSGIQGQASSAASFSVAIPGLPSFVQGFGSSGEASTVVSDTVQREMETQAYFWDLASSLLQNIGRGSDLLGRAPDGCPPPPPSAPPPPRYAPHPQAHNPDPGSPPELRASAKVAPPVRFAPPSPELPRSLLQDLQPPRYAPQPHQNPDPGSPPELRASAKVARSVRFASPPPELPRSLLQELEPPPPLEAAVTVYKQDREFFKDWARELDLTLGAKSSAPQLPPPPAPKSFAIHTQKLSVPPLPELPSLRDRAKPARTSVPGTSAQTRRAQETESYFQDLSLQLTNSLRQPPPTPKAPPLRKSVLSPPAAPQLALEESPPPLLVSTVSFPSSPPPPLLESSTGVLCQSPMLESSAGVRDPDLTPGSSLPLSPSLFKDAERVEVRVDFHFKEWLENFTPLASAPIATRSSANGLAPPPPPLPLSWAPPSQTSLAALPSPPHLPPPAVGMSAQPALMLSLQEKQRIPDLLSVPAVPKLRPMPPPRSSNNADIAVPSQPGPEGSSSPALP
eukprot:TRINITY_DN4031_c0_g1_i1.p1 TRINITY_DN4031_c0_g1~~TRINITY_DN4031_c0_g1_i1.p1  ORF type:complete len:1917 (+),score=290.80 TRINITY_DN4031_c0_g1_i1:241-5751(+)